MQRHSLMETSAGRVALLVGMVAPWALLALWYLVK